jgi:hypothetical protein
MISHRALIKPNGLHVPIHILQTKDKRMENAKPHSWSNGQPKKNDGVRKIDNLFEDYKS